MRAILGAGMVVAGAALALICGCDAAESRTPATQPTTQATTQPTTQPSESDPLGANAACYVCHMTFVKEELARTHLAKEIGCIRCHGASMKHANDEDVGASKPDITFSREQVNGSCRMCHPKHDAAPEKVIAMWAERGGGRKEAVCTDCHGKHRIERVEER